jgi:hypothetical protein
MELVVGSEGVEALGTDEAGTLGSAGVVVGVVRWISRWFSVRGQNSGRSAVVKLQKAVNDKLHGQQMMWRQP